MAGDEALLIAVQHVRNRIVVVRVAGDLARASLARLARLLDTCTAPTQDGIRREHLVLDLGEVRAFGPAGLQVIHRAADACAGASMSLHVTGIASHIHALPLHVGAVLTDLSCFPTVEDALEILHVGPEPAVGPVADIVRTADARQHPRRRRRAGPAVDGSCLVSGLTPVDGTAEPAERPTPAARRRIGDTRRNGEPSRLGVDPRSPRV